MLNLEAFVLPRSWEIPVCELNGTMHSMNPDHVDVSIFTNSMDDHPKVHITREMLHPSGINDEYRPVFLPTDTSFLKQLSQIYSEQGLEEVLNTMRRHPNPLVSKSAWVFLSMINTMQKVQFLFNPALKYHSLNLIGEVSQSRDWISNSIRCISWHPHYTKIAVATSDDNVRIYGNNNSQFVPILRYKNQKNITCLAWRPKSLTEIAVGHESGIIVWHIDFNSRVSRPSLNSTIILHRIEHKPILSLVWSPKGDLLASASVCDSSIIVWDVELDRTSHLKGSRDLGSTLLKWSPNGHKLLSLSNGIVFKIWDCHTWQSERWTVLSGKVNSACWTNCGTNVLFSTSTEPIIYGLTVSSEMVISINSDALHDHAVPLFDLARLDRGDMCIGGIVKCMETDPKGNTLAVMFKDTNYIALFNVIMFPRLQLIPSSLIMGLAAETPSTITFQQNFTAGACLTIGWSSGRLQHFPIIYSDLTSSGTNNAPKNPIQSPRINLH